ncbi:MAG: response regulator, partial [Methanomicrobiales archaeon]
MTKPHVIIVNDDPAQESELSVLLKKSGYTLSATESSGKDALKSETHGHPAIVLIDQSIPGGLDGVATAEQVQAKQNSPVIFIVSSEDEAKHAKVKHPQYGYISIPFNERELIIALESARYRQEAEQKICSSENELKKYRAHLETVIARRTA